MVLKISNRSKIPGFMVMDVMSKANKLASQGKSIIHLEVGQPSNGLPDSALNTLMKLMHKSNFGYTDAEGLYSLREKISLYYNHKYKVSVDTESVIITTGSSAAFQLAMLASFNPGDRVGIAIPGYPAYRNMLKSLSLEPILLKVGHETRYQVFADCIKDTDIKLNGLIVASPSNPAGTIIPPSEMKKLSDYASQNGIKLIVDEIYHGINFIGECKTALAYDKNIIVINSFSKYFCMTGWRIGWMIVPQYLRKTIVNLAQNFFISPPSISQEAAICALGSISELDKIVEKYSINRALILDSLSKLSLTKVAPSDGAFYLYVNVEDLTDNSLSLCDSLLYEANVALTPGVDFDPVNGKKFIRISFSGSVEDVKVGMNRISSWVNSQ